MNLALEIILVGLCFGVTYSSPVVANSSSEAVKPDDVKVTTVGPVIPSDHSKVPTVEPSIQDNTKATPGKVLSVTVGPPALVPTTKSPVKDEPVETETKAKPPLIIGKKNATVEIKTTSSLIPKTEATQVEQNATAATVTTQKPTESSKTTQNSHITTTTTSTTVVTEKPSTVPPKTTLADHVVHTPVNQDRQFDGPSFIGGIVLTVGLTVIGFIAFKFYKSGMIERNYRTL